MAAFGWLGMEFILVQGCQFHPSVKNPGYLSCDKTADCLGGFACVAGACLPDCEEIIEVAGLVPRPGGEDNIEVRCFSSQKDVPSPECLVIVDDAQGKPSRVEANLPSMTFLDLRPKEGVKEPECPDLLLRFSVLPLDGSEELSVLVRGGDNVGAADEKITLADDGEGDMLEGFADNTFMYMVSTETFPWPISVRILPAQIGESAHFVLRDFYLSCCRSF